MKRREFSRAVRVEIAKRATRADGQIACEKCGAIGLRLDLHHLEQDAMQIDKSRKLTAADGALWCKPCHDQESKAQAPILAKALAREAAHVGARKPSTMKGRPKPPAKPPREMPPRRPMFVNINEPRKAVK
jgi:hypothetical protein